MSEMDPRDVDELDAGLDEAVRQGHMERIPGKDGGEDSYRLTATGIAHVESLLRLRGLDPEKVREEQQQDFAAFMALFDRPVRH